MKKAIRKTWPFFWVHFFVCVCERLEIEIHKQLGKVLLSSQINLSSTEDPKLRWDKTQFPNVSPMLCASGYKANTDIQAVMCKNGVSQWLRQHNLVNKQCHYKDKCFLTVTEPSHRYICPEFDLLVKTRLYMWVR